MATRMRALDALLDLQLRSPRSPNRHARPHFHPLSLAAMIRSLVQAAIAAMSHSDRNTEYRSAVEDGDIRRADEIAFATIPDDWPEHDRAIWLARRTIARNRETGNPQSDRAGTRKTPR